MKPGILKLAATVAFLVCCNVLVMAQSKKKNNIPQVVKDSFTVKYPNTYVHEWEYKKKENAYEAEFRVKTDKMEAYFSPTGAWQYTKRKIRVNMIPEAVKLHLSKSAYGSWKIDDAEEYQSPEHPLYYKVEVELNLKEVDLYYLPNGTVIRTEDKQ